MPAKRATTKAKASKPRATKPRASPSSDGGAEATARRPRARSRTKPEVPAVEQGLAPAIKALEELTSALETSWKGVATAIEDLPRASDLQPLADHLYEFAVAAPKLIESIRGLPEALAPVERAGNALQEINDNLQETQATLQDALFHMPRPSEYEPLAEPLRDFARLSPSLIESLASVPRASALLDQATRRIEESTERLAAPAPNPGTEVARAAVARARASVEAALASIPDQDVYAPVARQLRELASVSPSLMAWLAEAPRLAAPLAAAVVSLREAAADLALAEGQLAAHDDLTRA